jgi:hypothetical protein
VNGPVVKVKYIPAGQKPENPVVGFHVDQYLLNRVSDGNNNVPHEFHRIPHSRKCRLDFGSLELTGEASSPAFSYL